MYKHQKIKYNPNEKSVGVPILAHSNEVIIPVSLAKVMHKSLKNNDPFQPIVYKRLKHLFSHTVVPNH